MHAGVPLEADGSATETIVNTSAIDVLRRLPGVTEGNYRPLMKAAGEVLAGYSCDISEASISFLMPVCPELNWRIHATGIISIPLRWEPNISCLKCCLLIMLLYSASLHFCEQHWPTMHCAAGISLPGVCCAYLQVALTLRAKSVKSCLSHGCRKLGGAGRAPLGAADQDHGQCYLWPEAEGVAGCRHAHCEIGIAAGLTT